MLRNSRLRWLLVLLAALSLLAAACGDDSGDDDTGGGDDGGGESALPACLDFPAIYGLVGPESTATTWAEAFPLAEEAGTTLTEADFPDVPLTITGPGEESGTFDSFVELAIEPVAEAQGVPEDNWLPRPDYTSSPNDNVIIEGVSGSEGSFGWVGFAFAEEAGDSVREFEIAGEDGTCVAPDPDSIASGEYPLARDLFIYVNADSIEDPAVKGYVDYYLGDDGYAAVSEVGYVQLTEDAWAETGTVWTDAGGAPGEPETGVSGEVVVSGSSTVEPISSAVAEGFSGENPEASISVDGPGTGDGFELFCNGETDISDASRPIDEDEIAACEENGIEYVELKIGIDGLSVITQG